MSSPFQTLVICLGYVYFVKVFGPRIMASRKPMDLKGLLIVYNLCQVLVNAWAVYQVTERL
jgi:anthranilate/para-aminobenzoate synthase component II